MKTTGTVVTLEQLLTAIRTQWRKANELERTSDHSSGPLYKITGIQICLPCIFVGQDERGCLLGFAGLGLEPLSGEKKLLVICMKPGTGTALAPAQFELSQEIRPVKPMIEEER